MRYNVHSYMVLMWALQAILQPIGSPPKNENSGEDTTWRDLPLYCYIVHSLHFQLRPCVGRAQQMR